MVPEMSSQIIKYGFLKKAIFFYENTNTMHSAFLHALYECKKLKKISKIVMFNVFNAPI